MSAWRWSGDDKGSGGGGVEGDGGWGSGGVEGREWGEFVVELVIAALEISDTVADF